jgi:hypothetical protein
MLQDRIVIFDGRIRVSLRRQRHCLKSHYILGLSGFFATTTDFFLRNRCIPSMPRTSRTVKTAFPKPAYLPPPHGSFSFHSAIITDCYLYILKQNPLNGGTAQYRDHTNSTQSY